MIKSFLSRLVSLLRRAPEAPTTVPLPPKAVPPSPPEVASTDDDDATVAPTTPDVSGSASPVRKRAPRSVPVETPRAAAATQLRIGVDFGTSTTQVAAYLEGRAEPFLVRLEDLTDFMPSFFALDTSKQPHFGSVAARLPNNVHSIKPLLVDDEAIDGIGHPSKVTYLLLEEVVRRTLIQLREQRLIPESLDRLEVATNLGCTPTFDLDTRVLLRDMARRAGLQVDLVNLIEEPVAAAYEIMLSGLVSDGVILVVDMGGGTLDVAVVKVSGGGTSFELFATGGSRNAGDRFTELIELDLQHAVAERSNGTELTRADRNLLWQRADAAKQALSVRRSAVVALGGVAGIDSDTVEVSREWLEQSSRRLRLHVEADVTNVYRMARLVLDRGGEHDPAPGTVDFDEPERGKIRKLTQVGLRDDGLAHVDAVVLVGGATNMPMIGELFRSIFGDKVIEPELVGIDRSSIVALGLARPKPSGMVNLRYPSWGVSAIFDCPDGSIEHALYEPFAPAFHVRDGRTSQYVHEVDVPGAATRVALAFRSTDGSGSQWPSVALDGDRQVRLELDLFGNVDVTAGSRPIYDGVRAPWSPAEADSLADWLPPWRDREWWKDMPTWDLVHDK
jgi:Ethanolamine utilization protein EutJ (predicted chaperonin)